MNYIQHANIYNLIIVCLIIYTCITSIYTPLYILSLLNKPISKISILVLILYYVDKNIHISIFLCIAFLMTTHLYSSITNSRKP